MGVSVGGKKRLGIDFLCVFLLSPGVGVFSLGWQGFSSFL